MIILISLTERISWTKQSQVGVWPRLRTRGAELGLRILGCDETASAPPARRLPSSRNQSLGHFSLAPLLGRDRWGQRLKRECATSLGDQGLRQLRKQCLWQDYGIEGFALLREAANGVHRSPMDDALRSQRRARLLSGLNDEARQLGLAAADAHQRLGDLRVVAEDAWRGSSLLHPAAQECSTAVLLDALEDLVLAARGGPWHDDLADVHVEVVVVQAKCLEERGELGSEWDASFDGDTLRRAREIAALERALDSQHLEWPRDLRNEYWQRVEDRPEALRAVGDKRPAVSVEPEADLLVLRGRPDVLAEEARTPARGARHALKHRGRPRVALDDEETATALLAEVIESVLTSEAVLGHEPRNRGLHIIRHWNAVEEEQVAFRTVAPLEGDPALDTDEPSGVLGSADEALPLPGVFRARLHAGRHFVSAGHHLDLLVAVDGRL